jgi:hypothetical protein
MVAYFYNMAFVIPEVNNTGYGFMNEFPKLYKRIYFRRNPEDPLGAPTTWVMGFRTNSPTRNVLVTRGANYVREGITIVHSSRLYGEMLTFVKDVKGIPRASGRNHDDLVMAFLLILELSESRPMRLEKETRPITLWDDESFAAHVYRMRKRMHAVTGRPKFF